ncbi:MAG: stimulus-sensing domain-containing protein [Alphaproteobacteria bacterium]|nr:stimulus-sensing domain-containing protein [Alphaproteobacteria bacterium]
MALDIVTATTNPREAASSAAPRTEIRSTTASRKARRGFRLRARRRLSPLTRRILAVNVLALALLGVGVLYLGEYQDSLVTTNLESLKTQAEIFAAALGEGAVDQQRASFKLDPQLARDMMRRLVEPTKTRARLFDAHGKLVADTDVLGGPGGMVQVIPLPAPGSSVFERITDAVYGSILGNFPWQRSYPRYVEPTTDTAASFPVAQRALTGDIGQSVQSRGRRGLILAVAVPVQHYRKVLGAVQLSMGSRDIENAIRSVRFEFLKVFAFALGVTVLLSIYLAGTIARPIRRLAAAAESVRRRPVREAAIPDLTGRGDEIGDLSGALREMTAALWQRVGAIERFAADVAHEIKNPLTSLKSAIETACRLNDREKERKLLALVLEDVMRLDRLISDISDASRLDADLARDEFVPVPLGKLLATLVQVNEAAAKDDAPRLLLTLPAEPDTPAGDLPVPGIEGRLVQVFRNLIANAVSFSPAGGAIRIDARRDGGSVVVTVDDEGPGIPEGKFAAIFDRFYSERPRGEKFGTHSGLGLSISKQIVDNHRGQIWAENRVDDRGQVLGARFVVRLPAV